MIGYEFDLKILRGSTTAQQESNPSIIIIFLKGGPNVQHDVSTIINFTYKWSERVNLSCLVKPPLTLNIVGGMLEDPHAQ